LLRREIPSPERMQLLARYLGQADDLEQLMQKVPEAMLHPPSAPGEWSPHQVLVHTRDVEVRAYHLRLERILKQDNPQFEDFDAEGWMRDHYRASEPAEVVVKSFVAARWRVKMLTHDMTPADWERTGTHAETGPRSFEWWMNRSIEHAQEHLDELARWLAAIDEEA